MPHATTHDAKSSLPTLDSLNHGGNFLLALMEAVSKDQQTLDQQQLTDAKTTEGDIITENTIYENSNKILEDASGDVQSADKDDVTKPQMRYNMVSSVAQAAESQQDGTVQASQGATSSDSQNLATKAQLAQGVQGISTLISNMLSQGL